MSSTGKGGPPRKQTAKAAREARLAAKLRQNLGRRKQQARSRTAADAEPKQEKPR